MRFTLRPGRRRACSAFATDVSERHAHQRELAEQATTDELTGALNRRGLVRFAERLVRGHGPDCAYTLFSIDLDGFKLVNDTLGHATGDALLASFAMRLGSAVRSGDAVARIGGDEFVVVAVGDLPQSAVEATAGRIHAAARRAGRAHDATSDLGCSIGIVRFSHGTMLPELLEDADRLMYRAKLDDLHFAHAEEGPLPSSRLSSA